ncbi:MAG TPA: hypothetical protein VF690_19795 [Hymenobacter sp.]|jgi:hypothetical protein
MNDIAPTINRSLVLFGLLLASSGQLRAQQPPRNQTDAQGRKVGHWLVLDTWGMRAAEGKYVRDRKVGEWRYYTSGSHASGLVCTVKYSLSGSFVETGGEYVLRVSADSTRVDGVIYGAGSALHQKPCLTCQKKGALINCRRLSFDGRTLYRFSLGTPAALFQVVRGGFCSYRPAP